MWPLRIELKYDIDRYGGAWYIYVALLRFKKRDSVYMAVAVVEGEVCISYVLFINCVGVSFLSRPF